MPKLIKASPIRKSVRNSFCVYHPDVHRKATYVDIKDTFEKDLKTAQEVADLYVEEMQSAQIYSKEVIIEIRGLLKEIDKHQNPYLLEAFAEFLWPDVDTDRSRKYRKALPYFKEIQDRATEIRAEDAGIGFRTGMRLSKPVKLVNL